MPHHVASLSHPRFWRGICTAGFATFLALVGHVLAGAPMPGWRGILIPGIFTAVVGVLIAGRRAALWRLWIISAVAQVFFHTLFVFGTDSVHHHQWSVAMVTAHAAAALGTALAQFHAERVFLAVVNFTFFVLSVLTTTPTIAMNSTQARAECRSKTLPVSKSAYLSSCLFTRGPPKSAERYLLAA